MNNKIFELLNNDVAIKKLNDSDVPTIVVNRGRLIFNNRRDDLFVVNGRSAFGAFRDSYKRIKVPVGSSNLVMLPTAEGSRTAVVYGRENDAVFLFPRYAYDLFDVMEYKRDTVIEMISYIIERFLYSDIEFDEMCRLILDRSNIFDGQVRALKLLMLAEQICRRITRREIFESCLNSDDYYLSSEDAISVITNLSHTIVETKPSSVSVECYENKLSIYSDGICLSSAELCAPEFMATQPFVTTVNDMVVSSLIAFASELYYYEI